MDEFTRKWLQDADFRTSQQCVGPCECCMRVTLSCHGPSAVLFMNHQVFGERARGVSVQATRAAGRASAGQCDELDGQVDLHTQTPVLNHKTFSECPPLDRSKRGTGLTCSRPGGEASAALGGARGAETMRRVLSCDCSWTRCRCRQVSARNLLFELKRHPSL